MNDPTPTPPEIIVTLTLALTGFGGNTHRGEYFYSYAPELVLLGKGQNDVRMRYQFDNDVGKHFQIRSLLSSDSEKQIHDVQIAADGRSVSFRNRNDVKTLISFTLVVHDSRRGINFGCDPQVGNDPEIEPILP